MCQVAYDSPSNFTYCADQSTDVISNLASGILFKTFLTRSNTDVMKSGLDCVQCVEVFPDSMNHCVPDWDGTVGKEMDILWEQTDLFSPSKGKWDSGHTRKSDSGFVPEIEFEELCWEDGQLLVVMQGLNSRGTAKNQIAYQTDDAAFPSVSPNSGMLDTPRVTELVDLPSVNMQTQEDDLFSWLQHPPEDLAERLEPPRDLPMVSTSVVPVSKSTRTNTPLCMGGTIGHGSTNQNSESSAKPALVLSTTSQKEVPCEPCLGLTADVEVLSQSSARSGSMSKQCGTLLPNPSSTTMNFSNFSRPAVAIKANLQSLGIANGLRVPERLKQLERVAGDKWKSDLTDSIATHSKVIAPRKEDSAVGASFIKGAQPNFPLPKKAKQIASAGGIVRKSKLHSFEKRGADQDISACNKSVLKGIQHDAWNSSFIDRTNAGVDPVTDVLEIPEASELSSSGGSEDSDVVDGQRVSTGKRKHSEEDSEIQSEALENEVKDHGKQGTAVGNEFKKSRASENHNQSERRRRDRITEKMKTLQALLPNSYKTDKASMLEEAIAYIKALKSQIQMMSYKSGMCFPPVVLSPGVPHVPMAAWPLMNTGIGMNMGMGMHAGMGMHDMNMLMAATALRPFSLPMMAFPNTLVPAGQANTSADLDTTPKTPGIAAYVLPPSSHQSRAPVRPGNPLYGKSDFTRVGSAAPSPSCPFSQQRHSLQT